MGFCAGIQAKSDSALMSPPPHSQWGFAVADAQTGTVLAEAGGDRFLTPASTVKLLTTAFAIEQLGTTHVFPTVLYRTGRIKRGVLNGDLWIKGNGNPALGSDLADTSQRIAAVFGIFLHALEQNGIRQVNGTIYGDGSRIKSRGPAMGALWEDVGNYYGAWPSGLCFHDNAYTLSLGLRGTRLTALETNPRNTGIPHFQIDAHNSGPWNGDSCYILGAFWNSPRVVAGGCPILGKPLKIRGSLPDPAWTCAREFEDYLRDHGTPVKGYDSRRTEEPLPYSQTLPAGAVKLVEHLSPQVLDLVATLHKKSDNLYAAQLLNLSGGAGALQKWLQAQHRKAGDAVDLEDGNGLSLRNRITPVAMTQFLSNFSHKRWFAAWRTTLPDGATQLSRSRGNSLPKGKSWIKTGSMSGIAAMAGYAQTQSGRLITFSVIVNHFDESPSAVRSRWESLLHSWLQKY